MFQMGQIGYIKIRECLNFKFRMERHSTLSDSKLFLQQILCSVLLIYFVYFLPNYILELGQITRHTHTHTHTHIYIYIYIYI